MHKLEIILKQHTPLIHFQHDQDGATLRASEIKPKLDKFIIQNCFENDYNRCKEYLIGYDSNKTDKLIDKFNKGYVALDYKIKITPNQRINISLNPHFDQSKRKYVTDDFSLILNNMGGKDSEEELADFSLYDTVDLLFISKNQVLKEKEDMLLNFIESWIDLFFATTNFGQRQDKGFGSFSVIRINGEYWSFPKSDLPTNTRYLKFSFPNNITNVEKQKKLFQVIDFYWKCLKSGINYTRDGKNPERYIKAFLWTYLNKQTPGQTWEKRQVKEQFHLTTGNEKPKNPNTVSFARAILGCPDKFEYKKKNKTVFIDHSADKKSDDYIARIPSPVIFKPIIEGNTILIYIITNESAIVQLKETNNLTFTFECDNQSFTMNVNPDIINVEDLIKLFHRYLNVTIKSKAFNNDDEMNDFGQQNNIENIYWFIPLDFNWRRIIPGNKSWVEMYLIKN